MKALRIDVFKNGSYDCTNGGISSKYNELLLVCDEGYIDIDENIIKELVEKYIDLFVEAKDCLYPDAYPANINILNLINQLLN